MSTGHLHLMVQIWSELFVSLQHFRYRLFLVVLSRIDRRNQKFFDLNTPFKNGRILVISALNQQLQPVFTFGALFQGNLQFCDLVKSEE